MLSAWARACGMDNMGRLARFLRALPLILISPFLTAAALAALAIADFAWLLRRAPASRA